jgi:hypothetical protein
MGYRLAHLPALLGMSAVLVAGAALVGGIARGGDGALGAAAGVALVVASYTFSTVVIAWADSINPRLVLPVGLGAYTTKFALFGLVMLAILNSGWAGILPMALGIVAGVLGWTSTQIWWVVRSGIPHGGPAPTGSR